MRKSIRKTFDGLLFAALLCLLPGGCALLGMAVQALSEHRLAGLYSSEEQYYIGRGVSGVIVHYDGIVAPDDDRTIAQIAYLNEMGGYLHRASLGVTRSAMMLGESERGADAQRRVNELYLHKDLQLGILDTDEVAAYATPGGFIWLSRGAIDMCETEDELAAIVAHELAHILLNHGMEGYRKEAQGQIGRRFYSQAGSYLSERFAGNTLGSTMGLLVTGVADLIHAQGYTPDQEHEADHWGTLALAASGYDPRAMKQMLERVREYEAAKPEAGEYLGNHPDINERIRKVSSLIERQGFTSGAFEAGHADRTRRFRAMFR